MLRKWFFAASLVVCCTVAIGCDNRDHESARRKRPTNFILISMDTVRADHLGCYGYGRDTTPAIDAYAKRGIIFEKCTSSSSWTVPAHHTIFTSMEPATHGCVYYPSPGRLSPKFDTMAKIFSRRGFKTAAFTGGGYVGKQMGFDVGFDHFESLDIRFEYNMEATMKWLDENSDEPFFLFMHGFNAHRPYVPPAPYKHLFAGDYKGNYEVKEFGPGRPRPDGGDLDYVISQYDGEIAFIDAMMGDFFRFLQQKNVLSDTLVILTSDHGDEFYEHGRCDHIHNLFDELTAVPWIMFGPGIPARRETQHVGTIDILPTVLSIFGLKESIPFQGVDLSALVYGDQSTREQTVFGFTGKGGEPKHLSSVRTDRWKLVTDIPSGGPNPKCAGCKQKEAEGSVVGLFDLQADPGEQQDVGKEHPKVVRELWGILLERLKECGTLAQSTETALPSTPEYLEALRTLGYVDGD